MTQVMVLCEGEVHSIAIRPGSVGLVEAGNSERFASSSRKLEALRKEDHGARRYGIGGGVQGGPPSGK